MASEVLEIAAMGAAGDGIARHAGGTVFVPGALPGEIVRAEIAGQRAKPEAWLRESPDRIAPLCRHFGSCGGCTLQHWAAAPYAAWKREKLVAALAAAGFRDAPVAELVRVPAASRRRADLALRRAAGSITLGLHATGQGAVVDLAECHVLDPRLVALFEPLRALLRRLPALKREGSAVLNLLDTGPDLLLRTDGVLDAAGRALLAGFAQAHGLPRIAWAQGRAQGSGQGNRPAENAVQLGPVALRFGSASVAPPPGAFLQASPGGEAAIIAAVLAGLPPKLPARARIVELHAGLGTLSFALATRARVEAYEGAAEAVAALAAAAGASGARIRATRRDLDRQPLAPAELHGVASLVLDPPYAGAAAQMPLLARARPPRILYVSCNPAALARDAKPLAQAGYRVVAATPIDQFPWSAHLEAVVAFSLGTT
ncbi:class I SAM-dependent RNA methyltransferase [Siccirubricoccus phaeus]|uniref:class I SAM-dependent RNA methyltransferase n=1 Tax=Siccirubricoccus phaeus TaxID=2595053 RepID=UPI0011F3B957|nr:TRAM domain-containing protein [Siccirubricoccus phaeus]